MGDMGGILKRSFQVLNALLWPIVILSLLTSFNVPDIFHLSAHRWGMLFIWLVLIIKSLLMIAFSAFIHGFLVDMATEKELFLSRHLLLNNARMFFKTAFLIYILTIAVHFIVFLILGFPVSLKTVQTVLFPLSTLIWIVYIFKKKFHDKPLNVFDPIAWGLLFIATLFFFFFFFLKLILLRHAPYLNQASVLIMYYVEFYLFLVLVHWTVETSALRNPSVKEEIYLVNPLRWGIFALLLSLFSKTPYVFVILKALTPQKYNFKEFNRVLWKKRYYKPGKLVAITSFTYNVLEAYHIAKEFKKMGSRVVMGGAHVTAFPSEALAFCDAVVIGPVESVWPRIIEDYEAGKMQGIYSAPPVHDDFKRVHAFLLEQTPEVIADCIETTRGCKLNCYFCGGGHAHTGYYKTPLSTVIALLQKAKQHSKELIFLDDNIYCDPAYSKELFRAIKPLNIRWVGSSSLDIANDPEALSLCKESGCQFLLIGYEVFPGSRETGAAKFHWVKDYIKLSRRIHSHGIGIKAHFIYGFEGDGFVSFWKLWWFALCLFPEFSALSILTPIPNSGFYKVIAAEDRLLNLNWAKYDLYSLVFKHPRINNGFFRNAGVFVNAFFILTTSRVGIGLLIALLCSILFSIKY